MISVRSLDTEYCCWFSFTITGINYTILKQTNKKVILHCNNISQYYCFTAQLNYFDWMSGHILVLFSEFHRLKRSWFQIWILNELIHKLERSLWSLTFIWFSSSTMSLFSISLYRGTSSLKPCVTGIISVSLLRYRVRSKALSSGSLPTLFRTHRGRMILNQPEHESLPTLLLYNLQYFTLTCLTPDAFSSH